MVSLRYQTKAVLLASVAAKLVLSSVLQAAAARDDRIMTNADQALQVWSTAKQKFVDENVLVEALASARYAILGEVHDNPLHHALRGRLVSETLKLRKSRTPKSAGSAAVFEHVAVAQQSALDQIQRQGAGAGKADPTPRSFFAAAQWAKQGWPNSEIFAPLIKAILADRLPLYAGGVPRRKLMGVMSGEPGEYAKGGSLANRLKLDEPLGGKEKAALLDDIAQAHCDVLPQSMLEPMAYGQRIRDATMADVMIKAKQTNGHAMLFTGNEHARRDRGVPWYLRARDRSGIVSLMLLETEHPMNAAADPPSADYVIWTATRKRPDPCDRLKEKFGKSDR